MGVVKITIASIRKTGFKYMKKRLQSGDIITRKHVIVKKGGGDFQIKLCFTIDHFMRVSIRPKLTFILI